MRISDWSSDVCSSDLRQVVEEGAHEIMSVLKEYEAINEQFGLPEVYENADAMEKLMNRQGELQDKLEAAGGWEIDSKLERAMDAHRCQEPATRSEAHTSELQTQMRN